jgi:sulfoxide reductase heme-binding subunit YedZ
MPKPAITALKLLLHLLCLAPFAWLLHLYTSGALALYSDPVNYITHFTGNWTIYILLASLAITPIRRLSPRIAFLIRFRRLIGLYAFFYATLHLATYVFLFSGYDFPAAFAGLRTGHPGAIITQWQLIWPGIVDDLRQRRFIQAGLIAWTILFALAITSPTTIMRAIGGKNWQRLHRLAYVAAIAAVIHFWWQVKPGVHTPWKVTAILAILLIARAAQTAIKRARTSPPQPLRSTQARTQQ